MLDTGNRLLGSVVALYRGELAFNVDGAGTVQVPWGNVQTLTSRSDVRVELASGERLSGPIDTPLPATLEILTSDGPRAAPLRDVILIQPDAADFRSRTRGAVDLGFDLLGANDEVDLTLHVDVANRTEKYLTQANLDSLLRRLNDETAQRRNRLDLKSRRFLNDRWFVLGDLLAEENRELQLDSRVLLALAAGRTLVQSNRTIVSFYGGAAYDLERYDGIPGSESSTEIVGAFEFDWFEVGGNTELTTLATVYVNPARNRERVEIIVRLRRQLAGSYYWSFSLYESYDSNPPADFVNDDQALHITFGRSF